MIGKLAVLSRYLFGFNFFINGIMVPLVVGGQLGEYPARWLVTLDGALSVARSFFDAGEFGCGVSWEYQTTEVLLPDSRWNGP